MQRILVIQTGGTIDKCYPKKIGGYAFEIGSPAFEKVFTKGHVDVNNFRTASLCKKDSQEIDESDRQRLADMCVNSIEKRILITHGTDTILETAEFLSAVQTIGDKLIVLTGSFLPECMVDTDADFNLGMAFASVQLMPQGEIYLAIDGKIAPWNQFQRDLQSGDFKIVS